MPKIMSWQERQEKAKERQEKAKERNKRYVQIRAQKTKVYTVRVYYGSEIYTATEKAASDAGKQPGQYLREALIEKLRKDGYMLEDNDEEPVD